MIGGIAFGVMLIAGVIYIWTQLSKDLSIVHDASIFPFVLLGVALLIALGFEFVNGFHDTANAVATVIYTHSLEPHIAVVYSGILNFVGVLLSTGTVAYSVITLLPVELILKVSKGSGLPWSSHCLSPRSSGPRHLVARPARIELPHHDRLHHRRRHHEQLMQGNPGTSGVEWPQVTKVFTTLALSPVVGFIGAALLFLLFKFVARDPRLFKAPEGSAPPPFYIRLLLIGTCGGVSYFHGSNDGQKGMGLIMLILVGTVPTAYALNHTVSAAEVQTFAAVSTQVAGALQNYVEPTAVVQEPGAELENFRQDQEVRFWRDARLAAGGHRDPQRGHELRLSRQCARQYAGQRRNQMYLTSEAFKNLAKAPGAPKLSAGDAKIVGNYKSFLDKSTRFIPTWVKVAVALALGLGTMIGWTTHRRHRRRKNWEDPPHLRPGRFGRNHGHVYHRPRRRSGTSSQYDARTFFRRSRYHGGQQERSADVHHPRHRAGLDLHPAGCRAALRLSLLALQQDCCVTFSSRP